MVTLLSVGQGGFGHSMEDQWDRSMKSSPPTTPVQKISGPRVWSKGSSIPTHQKGDLPIEKRDTSWDRPKRLTEKEYPVDDRVECRAGIQGPNRPNRPPW